MNILHSAVAQSWFCLVPLFW